MQEVLFQSCPPPSLTPKPWPASSPNAHSHGGVPGLRVVSFRALTTVNDSAKHTTATVPLNLTTPCQVALFVCATRSAITLQLIAVYIHVQHTHIVYEQRLTHIKIYFDLAVYLLIKAYLSKWSSRYI